MVLSIAQPCEVSGHIVGVVGIDLSLSEVVENVTYFNTYGNSYAFFINKEGVKNAVLIMECVLLVGRLINIFFLVHCCF